MLNYRTLPPPILNSVRLSLLLLMAACNGPSSAVDDTPFRAAVASYLQSNNMAMKIKEVKEGPVIDGNTATLTASMTHEQLSGPSVTWKLQFAKQSDRSWQVTRHEVK